MVRSTKVNGRKVKNMAREFILFLMKVSTKVSLLGTSPGTLHFMTKTATSFGKWLMGNRLMMFILKIV